jgi:hypothetical protein
MERTWKATGGYRYDCPAVNFRNLCPIEYNRIFGEEGNKKELQDSVYFLNSKSELKPSEGLYDCFNWVLGFRYPKYKWPISDGYEKLAEYGFLLTNDEPIAKIAVYIDSNGVFVHAHVKLEIQTEKGKSEMWTSKIGTDPPFILGYPNISALRFYYQETVDIIYFALIGDEDGDGDGDI